MALRTGVLTVAFLGRAVPHRASAPVSRRAPSTLGSWTGAIVALAVLSDFRRLRVVLRPALPWFLAGCGVTLVSLLIQFALSPDTPAGMTRLSPNDFSTFIRLWDGHRAAVNIWHNGVMLNVASLVVATAWLLMAFRRSSRTSTGVFPVGALLLESPRGFSACARDDSSLVIPPGAAGSAPRPEPGRYSTSAR